MKVSDFLKKEIAPFLYGAFMSRIMIENKNNKDYFYCYTSFKQSNRVPPRIFGILNYANTFIDELNFISGVDDWQIHNMSNEIFEARLYLENDQNLTKQCFYRLIYQKLMKCQWVYDDELNDDKKDFIRGFVELRGSVDTSAKYISQDYFFDNRIEFKKAQIVTDYMSVPIKYANYNMRDLQPQFVDGINRRNPQFRINSYYYAKYVGFLNKYKAKVFEKTFANQGYYEKNDIFYFNLVMPNSKSDNIAFIKYLNFFTNNIYEKQLTKEVVKEFRLKIGFDSINSTNKILRNKSITDIFDEISEDKCAICGTKTTYLKPNGRQYFEIHHVISLRNNSDLDNIANLVKLCPTCHRMMKRGSSTKEKQISSIIKILYDHEEIREFCQSYLNSDDVNELAEMIFDRLG